MMQLWVVPCQFAFQTFPLWVYYEYGQNRIISGDAGDCRSDIL